LGGEVTLLGALKIKEGVPCRNCGNNDKNNKGGVRKER